MSHRLGPGAYSQASHDLLRNFVVIATGNENNPFRHARPRGWDVYEITSSCMYVQSREHGIVITQPLLDQSGPLQRALANAPHVYWSPERGRAIDYAQCALFPSLGNEQELERWLAN